ncbi:MAG: carboxypeptidase-like regulatory domain-containing protein [Candidatus Acidiferrum sp.]
MKERRAFLWLVILLLAVNGSAFAQGSKKETQLKTVRGIVNDSGEKPIPNAVVFLKNLRTNSVLSHFSDDQGNYRFTGLDPNVDYEIYAEFDGQKSSSRTVSSLDSRRDMTLNLKVDRKKN